MIPRPTYRSRGFRAWDLDRYGEASLWCRWDRGKGPHWYMEVYVHFADCATQVMGDISRERARRILAALAERQAQEAA